MRRWVRLAVAVAAVAVLFGIVSSFAASPPVPVPEPSEKARSWFRGGNILWAVNNALDLIVPALILFTGLSARIRDLARRLAGGRWYLTLLLYFVFFSLLMSAIALPLGFYQSYVRPHAYGLSNQSLGKWIGDWVKGLLVSLVGAALVLWAPYKLLERSPKRWWLYTALLAAPVIVFFVIVAPIWVDPLFNDFGPMKDTALEARILGLADRAGIEGSRVYEVAKSVDTKTVNAYVTGFGATKRVVLWDTIIAKLTPEQLLFVMGHEMGHYVLGHVLKSIPLAILGVALVLFTAHRISGWFLSRFEGRIGFSRLADPASLPLILLVANLLGLVISPAVLAITRHYEHEADRFGLEITRDNRAAAEAFVVLQQENLGIPRPGRLYKLLRASHPPLGERIDFCNAYRPWEQGEPLVYGGRFRGSGPSASPPP